jgi:hypothetical protein
MAEIVKTALGQACPVEHPMEFLRNRGPPAIPTLLDEAAAGTSCTLYLDRDEPPANTDKGHDVRRGAAV